MKLEISGQIFQNPEISNLMKIIYAGAELFHADGQTHRQMDGPTDTTKVIIALRSFANAPSNRFSFAALFVFRCENQAVPFY